MIFDFCQCHPGCRRSNKQFISDPEKHIGSTPLTTLANDDCRRTFGIAYALRYTYAASVIDATVKMPGGDDNFADQSVLTFSIVVTKY